MRPESLSVTRPSRRVRRRSHQMHLDTGEHGNWAVSYADMLMVLMSLFIIFFQFNELQKPDDFARLKMKLAGHLQTEGTKKGGTGSAIDEDPTKALMALKEVATRIGLDKVVWNADTIHPSLVVYLDENTYSIGAVDLTGDGKKEFLDVVKALVTSSPGLYLHVTGHTDTVPVTTRRFGKLVDSNFALANVRATRAAALAIANGLPQNRVMVDGAGSAKRQTRSLTLRITAGVNL